MLNSTSAQDLVIAALAFHPRCQRWNACADFLEKSSRRVQRSPDLVDGSSNTLETEWTMASHPILTPTPTWRGEKVEIATSWTARDRHFDVRRRRTSPTAMGRRRPFFTQARRVVPQRCGITSCGARPAARSLTTPKRARIAWAARSGEGHRTASFRWFPRRLYGPGAEPLGKDFKALRTSWSEMLGGEGVGSGGMGGGGDWGCFVSIFSTPDNRAWMAFF